jgi:hypothetical protein
MGFPIPDYPMSIQRAHDFAKITGLEVADLEQMLMDGITAAMDEGDLERVLRIKYLSKTLANLRYKEA